MDPKRNKEIIITKASLFTNFLHSLILFFVSLRKKYEENMANMFCHSKRRHQQQHHQQGGWPCFLGMHGDWGSRRTSETQMADWQPGGRVFEPPTHGTSECYQLLRDKAITAEPAKLIKSLVSPPERKAQQTCAVNFEIILSSVLCKYFPSGKIRFGFWLYSPQL